MLARLIGDTKQMKAATIVDGKLILSFPEALTPIVWQMDLAEAKSSSFEVVQEDSHYTLITKVQGAAKKDSIASFQSRESAVSALMATSGALAGGHGHIRGDVSSNVAQAPVHTIVSPTYAQAVPAKKGSIMKWIGAILVLAVLLGLISAMASMRPSIPTSVDNAAGFGGVSNNTAPADPANSAGVPVSADDFLNSR